LQVEKSWFNKTSAFGIGLRRGLADRVRVQDYGIGIGDKVRRAFEALNCR
jgi:hypothetical protein